MVRNENGNLFEFRDFDPIFGAKNAAFFGQNRLIPRLQGGPYDARLSVLFETLNGELPCP